MRLVKESEIEYTSFLDVINNKSELEQVALGEDNIEVTKKENIPSIFSKDNFEEFLRFEENIERAKNIVVVAESLNNYLTKNVFIKGSFLCLFNKTKTTLKSVGNSNYEFLEKYLKYINTKSSSERFFENEKNSKQPLPHIHEYNDKKGKILVIPILLNERRKGLLLLSVIDAINDNFENNINLIKSALKVTMLKFESLMYKYKSTNYLNELQLYESKLSNGYRLMAIGELVNVSMTGILNPMQTILSLTELLEEKENNNEKSAKSIIKDQINDVKNIITNIIKFARKDKYPLQIQATDLNRLIKEYHDIASISLYNKDYEFILDLQDDIPLILSNRNYIHQFLINIFDIIISQQESVGGILVQTRYSNDLISLRVVSSDYIEVLDEKDKSNKSDLSLNILRKLIKKHHGIIEVKSSEETGSIIILKFPIK